MTTHLSLLILIAGAFSSMAQTLSLKAVADTSLFQNAANNNLGKVSFMPIGVNSDSQVARGLVRFDLSQLPAGATVLEATLTLRATSGSGSHTLDLHRMLSDWTEGSGSSGPDRNGSIGNAAQPGESTWNRRAHPNVSWQAAGGASGTDYASSASASVVVNSSGNKVFTGGTIAADIQNWLQNPSSNFGWLIKARGEAAGARGTAHRYASREDTANAPALTIIYRIDDPVSAPVLEAPSRDGQNISFRFAAQEGVAYTVEHTSVVPNPAWATLTHFPSGPARTITVSDPLTPEARFYRVKAQR